LKLRWFDSVKYLTSLWQHGRSGPDAHSQAYTGGHYAEPNHRGCHIPSLITQNGPNGIELILQLLDDGNVIFCTADHLPYARGHVVVAENRSSAITGH
jgi:hypothetical protein